MVTKTLLEMFVVTPCFEIPCIVMWTGLLGRNQSVGEAYEQLCDDFPRAVLYGFGIWGPNGLCGRRAVFLGARRG